MSDDTPPITIEDTLEILDRLKDHAGGVVLIGGQAVNAWAGQFLDAFPELESLGPYSSKDIDFQADLGVVEGCARALGQPLSREQEKLSEDFIGYLDFPSSNGARRVDFLRSPLGLAAPDVKKLAVDVTLFGAPVRVMHPLHCLISRAANIVGRPEKYDTDHGNRQLRAAMASFTSFLRASCEDDNTRGALERSKDSQSIAAGPLPRHSPRRRSSTFSRQSNQASRFRPTFGNAATHSWWRKSEQAARARRRGVLAQPGGVDPA